MLDHMSIGPSPSLEPCAQLGTDNYPVLAKRECRAFIGQLERQLGEPPGMAQFVIKANPHDFGVYYEVNVQYDDTVPEEVDFALKVESEAPEHWDDAAKLKLT